MSFAEWLRKQVKRQTAIGDFARDWFADKTRPKGPLTVTKIWEHLDSKGGVPLKVYSAAYAAGVAYAEQMGVATDAVRGAMA